MWKYSIIAAAVLALSACGQQSAESADDETPPTMPEVTFAVAETDANLEVVMEATVEVAPDGSWERTGTEAGSGTLTDEEVERIGELVEAADFPEDPDDDTVCTAVMPPYAWTLTAGEDTVSNGNGGCVSSDSAVEIAAIIQEAAEVGPTQE